MATAAVPESFNADQAIKAYFSGTSQEPLETTAGILNSLKQLADFEANKASIPADLRGIYEQEVKWLKRGIKAVNESPVVRNRLGSDFNACVTASGIMKRLHADKAFEEILQPFAFTDADKADIKKRAFSD